MRKENVFVVSGRSQDQSGDLRGPVITHLVCGADPDSAREFALQKLPGFAILSMTNLEALEASVRKIKAVLAGTDTSWSVFVEPGV